MALADRIIPLNHAREVLTPADRLVPHSPLIHLADKPFQPAVRMEPTFEQLADQPAEWL